MDKEKKYHLISEDGLPKEEGHYMVKVHIEGMPIYDNKEFCFRDFKDGQFNPPYYSNPRTDTIIGWYEND